MGVHFLNILDQAWLEASRTENLKHMTAIQIGLHPSLFQVNGKTCVDLQK